MVLLVSREKTTLIRPSLGHVRLMEFDKAEEAFEAGYNEAMKVLKETRVDLS